MNLKLQVEKRLLCRCVPFSSILVFIHFKLILESCTTSRVYLESYQTHMMKLLAVCIFAETLHNRYSSKYGSNRYGSQGTKCGCAASFFNIFPLYLSGYLNEYMNNLFFFRKCAATLLRDTNQKYFKIFHWFPNHASYWPWQYQIFIYLYDRDAKKLTLKILNVECTADIYY